jgi:hypothetical protein
MAVAESGRGSEVRQLGVFENRPEVLSKLAARLSNKNCRISFCYEAGPCGYGLHRLLTSYGHDCVVVAVGSRWWNPANAFERRFYKNLLSLQSACALAHREPTRSTSRCRRASDIASRTTSSPDWKLMHGSH